MQFKSKASAPLAAGSGGKDELHRARPEYSEQEIARKRRFLDLFYDWLRKQWRPIKKPMHALRLSELERLYAFRWGTTLPPDDAGEDDLIVALNHIALSGSKDVIGSMLLWTRRWAPWMAEDQARALCGRIAAAPERYNADDLADRMRLDLLDRDLLKIKTIGAFNLHKPIMQAFRRLRKNAKRRKQTRAEYEANSISKREPWKAEGISKATYYRRLKKQGETSPSL